MTYLLHNGSTSYINLSVDRQTEKDYSISLYRPETEWSNYDQIEIFWQKNGRSNT